MDIKQQQQQTAATIEHQIYDRRTMTKAKNMELQQMYTNTTPLSANVRGGCSPWFLQNFPSFTPFVHGSSVPSINTTEQLLFSHIAVNTCILNPFFSF